MRVEVQYAVDCPNAREVLRRVKQLAAACTDLRLELTPVELGGPVPAGFAGSPTVLVDGKDPFGATPIDAPACALHPPTPDQVEAAIAAT